MLYPEMYLLAARTAEGTLPLLKEFPLRYNIPTTLLERRNVVSGDVFVGG